MNESQDQQESRSPHRLDYAGPNAPKPRWEIVAPLSLGCVYGVVAIEMSLAIVARSHWNAAMVFLVPALLLGGPFVFSLRVKGWRAFALGIAIIVGLVVLLVGTCGVLLSH